MSSRQRKEHAPNKLFESDAPDATLIFMQPQRRAAQDSRLGKEAVEMEWLYLAASLASALAAVLAWAAKLWWSKEYAEAKNEIISSKNAQIDLLKAEIENLRELTPMKIREYFVSVKQQLEEYIEALNAQLAEARREIEQKQEQLGHLQAEGAQKRTELERVEGEKRAIENAARELEQQVLALRHEKRAGTPVQFAIPLLDLDAIRRSVDASAQLSHSLAKQVVAIDLSNISRITRQYEEASATAAAVAKMWASASVEKPSPVEGGNGGSKNKP